MVMYKVKTGAVFVFFVLLIQDVSSTLSKSDRGKKKKDAEEAVVEKKMVNSGFQSLTDIYCQKIW